MDKIAATLPNIMIQLPVFVVWLIGLILAIVYWRQNRWISLLAIVAIIGFVLTTLYGTYYSMWAPIELTTEMGLPMQDVALRMAKVSSVLAYVRAVMWVLLFLAMFGWWQEKSGTS